MLDDTPRYDHSGARNMAQTALIRHILDANDIGVPAGEKFEVDHSDWFLRSGSERYWELCLLAGWDGDWLRDAYVSGKIDATRLKSREFHPEDMPLVSKMARKDRLRERRKRRYEHILELVRAKPGITSMEIAAKTRWLHRATVASALRAMRESGLVTSRPTRADSGRQAESWRLAGQ